MNCKNKSFMTKRKAFTLIELLIVIAIIGILFIVLVSKVDFATDKAKATGVQTDFRSFQMAFDTVAKENAGFNTFGWDTGDANQNGKRDSYDEGDNGAGGGTAKNGIQDGAEVFTGHKVYAETFTKVYSLKKAKADGTLEANYDREALNRLETAINANLDPKLHITIKDDGEIIMANGAQDPWNKEYHGWYITNAEIDKADRGAIVMYSDGANNEFGSEHDIANGVPTVIVPGNNKNGADDYSLVVCYTHTNGYGEVGALTTGFSNNQTFLTGNGSVDNLGTDKPDIDEPENLVAGATFTDGVTLTWDELKSTDNGTKYGYSASEVTDNTIGYKAFYNCLNLTSINIPDSVTSIGFYSFYGCTSLASVNFVEHSQVTEIGFQAFYKCTALTSVSIPNSVVTIDTSAFGWCNSLEIVTIGHQVETIGQYAFMGCKNIKSISIPDSVANIQDSAFAKCTNLTDVTIGRGVQKIGYEAFYECPNMTNVYITDLSSWCGIEFYDYRSNPLYYDKNVYINGELLSTLVLPDNITSVSAHAFYNCNSITEIVIPSNVTEIKEYAFYSCKGISSLEIPNNVTTIGKYAFYACTNVLNLVLPDSITTINEGAFGYFMSITTLNIPNSVTTIGPRAFCDARSLKNIDIPYGVTTIGKNAFSQCTALETISIPSSVTSIGEGALGYNRALTTIEFIGTVEQWNNITKGLNWCVYAPATAIICSDGNVSIK